MKISLILFLFLFSISNLNAQEKYMSIAPSGLIIRDAPDPNSKRIGKLPFGSLVEILTKTNVKHQIKNENLNGIWVKIKYENFPYKISDLNDFEHFEEGFVFSGYLEKLNKAKINSTEIDSLTFFSMFRNRKQKKPEEIKSQRDIEVLLKNKVTWKNTKEMGRVIDEIKLENGQVLPINQKSNDYTLVSYFPEERILLFEGGHTSDFSISLKTGETLETVGNPNYIVESPNKQLRLNGWFPGQECSSYFFQEKSGNTFNYLVEFGWGSEIYGKNVCNFNKFDWISNTEFIYSFTDYSEDKAKEKYFKNRLIKSE